MLKSKTLVMSPNEVAAVLQSLLVDLIALSLQAKQAHWNVVGPGFQPLHALFDEMADAYRGWYDRVAERLRALKIVPDGRPSTVAESTQVEDLPSHEITDKGSVRLMLDRIEQLIGRLRPALQRLGEADLVTQDMAIEIVEGLEKQAWMLRAHRF